MPNAIWKGNISFGLVNVPIILYSSEDKSESISFRQIDKRDNARIRHQRINAETGAEVPWSEVARGYEYDKDKIMVVKEGELEKVAGDNAKTIAIESFVDKKNINFINVDKAYYLVPDKKGDKGYVILREALNKQNKVGIAKIIISTKEYLAAISTYENALVVYTLKYDDEIRKLSELPIPSTNLNEYKVNKKEIEIAEQLINSMTTKWHPETYKDEFKDAVHAWIEKRLKHETPKVMKRRGEKAKTPNVVDFVSLLKKSLSASKPAKNDKKFKQKTSVNHAKGKVKRYVKG